MEIQAHAQRPLPRINLPVPRTLETAPTRTRGRLLAHEPRTQERHHVLGIRIAPEHLLLEDEVAVDVDVEHAADSRHEVDAGDVLLEFLENLRRQTDSVGERASGDAVLDADPRPVAHSSALTCSASQSRIRFHESIR